MEPDWNIESKRVGSLDKLLKVLESHCYSTTIVTVVGATEEGDMGRAFDFDMTKEKDDTVGYGEDVSYKALIVAKISGTITSYPITVVNIRSLLDDDHPETGYPYKEIRSYRAWSEEREDKFVIEFEAVSAREVLESYTVQPGRGEEKEAIYCGPDEEIRGENL